MSQQSESEQGDQAIVAAVERSDQEVLAAVMVLAYSGQMRPIGTVS